MEKQGTRILDAIRHGFSRRRGRTIPEGMRRLALSAMDRGHTAGEIARVAGVSRQSVMNWSRRTVITVIASKVPLTPIELKVVESRPQTHSEREENGATARITLRSGAIVEVLASALDPKWLVALNGGAS